MLASVTSIKLFHGTYVWRLQLELRFEVARANAMPIGWIAPTGVVHLAKVSAASG